MWLQKVRNVTEMELRLLVFYCKIFVAKSVAKTIFVQKNLLLVHHSNQNRDCESGRIHCSK